MRPILTLKKRSAAPNQPQSWPRANQPVAKSAKDAAQATKDARAEANRQLARVMYQHRAAGAARLQPLLDAYLADFPLLRDTVVVDGAECFRPLAIGVHKTLIAWLRALPEAEGCSNTLLADLIKAALQPHVSQSRYRAGLVKFQQRFDLDGQAVGPIADKHKARAEKLLQRRAKADQPAAEDPLSASA